MMKTELGHDTAFTANLAEIERLAAVRGFVLKEEEP